MADVIIKGMKMPEQCIVNDNYCGTCPLDRTWCMQRYAPDGYTMMQAFQDRNGKLPDWCPLRPAPKWISVTERLPEENGRYLVRYKRDIVLDYTEVHDDEVRIMRFFVGTGWRYPFLCQPELRAAEQQTVTHWMPLPILPSEG